MNIHHVLDNLQIGGAETLVVALARMQQRDGHRVAVHGLYGGGPLAAKLEEDRIPLYTHGGRSAPLMIATLAFRLRMAGADVVHCHNITSTVTGARAARFAGASRVISTRHGMSTSSAGREEKFWRGARLCDSVVAVSDVARNDIGRHPMADIAKLITVYNGADPAIADANGDTAVPKQGVRFISVGRFTSEKDFPSLLRAFALVHRQVPDAELWIVGDGAQRPAIEAVIDELSLEDCVRLVGMRKNVGFWFAQSDVFVLSSISEGLPMTLLEAMAAGLPSIVTEVGGMPEVVQSCGAGVVVPASQPAALGEAMIQLARNAEQRLSYGNAAKSGYATRFTLRHMAEKYMSLYRGKPA